MKKLFTLVLLFCSLQSFGQLTLVKEIKESFNFIPFRLNEGKWMLSSVDENNNKFQSITFYNKDLSVYKNLKFSKVFPHDTIGYKNNYLSINSVGVLDNSDDPSRDFIFSNNFFNSDDKIEFILVYRSEQNINSNILSKNTSIIINEDGEEIQRFSSFSKYENENLIRFWFWNYLNVTLIDQNNLMSTKIYSVPGNLPCPTSCSQKAAAITPISQPNEFKKIQVNGFPNPSSDNVTLEYSLPEGTPFGTLRLYSQTGVLVKEFKVSSQVDHLELPVSDYTPGTYYYELQAGGSSSGGKKMVVIH